MRAPRFSLWDVFAAYWDDLSSQSRARHLVLWLSSWGAAIAARYRRCAYCETVFSPSELRSLPVVLAESQRSTLDVRECVCGSWLTIEREK